MVSFQLCLSLEFVVKEAALNRRRFDLRWKAGCEDQSLHMNFLL